MKILYLFNRPRALALRDVREGKDHDTHFFGMLRLSKFGIEADILELESLFPPHISRFLRKYIFSIHTVHIPLIPWFRSYDYIFTSAAFGTLGMRILLGLKRPRWILFDYGVAGLIGERRTWRQRLLYRLVSSVSGVVTISAAEKVAMQNLFPAIANKIVFIPLGVDTHFFTPGHDIIDPSVMLAIGRDPGRDWKTLFQAVMDLPIHVKITGKLEHIRKAGPLPPNVSIHDFTPLELVDELQKAGAMLLPLNPPHPYDSMGCSTLVESMAMGKAIIATHTATTESYIEHNVSGLLVPRGDVAAFREAIHAVYTNNVLRERLGKAARQQVERLCDADVFARSLADYFRSLDA